MKHLLLEHQHEIANKKLEAEMAVKMAQDDDREVEIDIKEDRRNLNNAIKDLTLSHNEFIRALRREQDQKVTELRHQFERRANEILKTFEVSLRLTTSTRWLDSNDYHRLEPKKRVRILIKRGKMRLNISRKRKQILLIDY